MRLARAPHVVVALPLVLAVACKDKKKDADAAASSSASAGASMSSSAIPSGATSAPALPVTASARAPSTPPLVDEDLVAKTLEEQRDAMLRRMKASLGLSEEQLESIRKIMKTGRQIGQGNPEVTEYAMTRAECRKRRDAAGVSETPDPICGAPFMSALYDPGAGQKREDAKVCIDRYEFPGIPCEYPVTWIQARDAALMCKAIGKRLCDAHEWEGACAGALHDPDREYLFNKPRRESKLRHNQDREIVWAYGSEKDFKKCAMSSKKSKKCAKSGWKVCGSNSYPAGSFPECRSKLDVYDLHGNVAEHMSLPLRKQDLGSRGGAGETEMKGSWFIFDRYEAHEDDCRWRAPAWHATKLMSFDSHLNYHLGFRCCKDVGG